MEVEQLIANLCDADKTSKNIMIAEYSRNQFYNATAKTLRQMFTLDDMIGMYEHLSGESHG